MKITNILLYIIYAVVVITAGVYSFNRPENNWDILPYVASVYSLESTDTNRIHADTYNEIKSRVDAKTYAQLTTGEYREAMANCAKCFLEQLPFYKIKALYVIFIYFLYKLGVNVYEAPFFISCVSYFLVNIICFFWIRFICKNRIFSVVFSIVFAFFPFMLNSASEAAPNMLSAFFILSALYSLVIKKKFYPFLALMILAVIARPDNIILLALMLGTLFYYMPESIKLKRTVIVASFIAVIIIFKLTGLWAANYSWKILFEHGFSQRIILPAEHDPAFNIWMYIKAFLKWAVMLKSSAISIHALIFAAAVYVLTAQKTNKLKTNFDLIVIIVTGVSIAVHYLLYPVIEDNYFIAQYIIVDLIFIKCVMKISAENNPAFETGLPLT